MSTLVLRIKVKPNAKVSRLLQDAEGGWQAQLKAPPLEGRANEALRRLVANHFGTPLAAVQITGGLKSRTKRVEVSLADSS